MSSCLFPLDLKPLLLLLPLMLSPSFLVAGLTIKGSSSCGVTTPFAILENFKLGRASEGIPLCSVAKNYRSYQKDYVPKLNRKLTRNEWVERTYTVYNFNCSEYNF